MSREILTLQFGHSSNFVGTHFWNIQESSFHTVNDDDEIEELLNKRVDHDVLFREGRNIFRQVTFTPRLILYDLKGSLKTLPECGGSLYAEEEGEVLWSSDVTLHKTQAPAKNEFLRECEAEMEMSDTNPAEEDKDLDERDGNRKNKGAKAVDDDVDEKFEVWSDFLGTQLHPRSLNIINDYYHDSVADMKTSFDFYVQGWNLLGTSSELREEFEDERIRYFAEECDYLQGFQLLCDAHNGFSGMATGASEYLQDEYHGRSVFSLPLIPVHLYTSDDTAKMKNVKLLNYAMCLGSLSQTASAICPVGLSQRPWSDQRSITDLAWLNCDFSEEYHTSAVIATALDTLTLGCRTKSPQHSFGMYSSLTDCGQKLLTLDVSLPFPLSVPDNTLYHTLGEHTASGLLSSLNPFVSNIDNEIAKEKTYATFVSLRGVPDNRTVNLQERKKNNISAHLVTREDFLGAFIDEYYGRPFQIFSTDNRLSLRRPYPTFFGDTVTASGDVIDAGFRSKNEIANQSLPESLAVLSSLRATSEVGQNLQEFRSIVEKINAKLCLPEAATDVIELDDVKNILEQFYQLCDNY